MRTGALSPGVKRPRREANYSPPSSSEVKNDNSIPPLPHTPPWFSALINKTQGQLTFLDCGAANSKNCRYVGQYRDGRTGLYIHASSGIRIHDPMFELKKTVQVSWCF
jgi:hypothetical protein